MHHSKSCARAVFSDFDRIPKLVMSWRKKIPLVYMTICWMTQPCKDSYCRHVIFIVSYAINFGDWWKANRQISKNNICMCYICHANHEAFVSKGRSEPQWQNDCQGMKWFNHIGIWVILCLAFCKICSQWNDGCAKAWERRGKCVDLQRLAKGSQVCSSEEPISRQWVRVYQWWELYVSHLL